MQFIKTQSQLLEKGERLRKLTLMVLLQLSQLKTVRRGLHFSLFAEERCAIILIIIFDCSVLSLTYICHVRLFYFCYQLSSFMTI